MILVTTISLLLKFSIMFITNHANWGICH